MKIDAPPLPKFRSNRRDRDIPRRSGGYQFGSDRGSKRSYNRARARERCNFLVSKYN